MWTSNLGSSTLTTITNTMKLADGPSTSSKPIAHVVCTMCDQIKLSGSFYGVVRAIMALESFESHLWQFSSPRNVSAPSTEYDVFDIANDIAKFTRSTRIRVSDDKFLCSHMSYRIGSLLSNPNSPEDKLIIVSGDDEFAAEFKDLFCSEVKNPAHVQFVDPSFVRQQTTLQQHPSPSPPQAGKSEEREADTPQDDPTLADLAPTAETH